MGPAAAKLLERYISWPRYHSVTRTTGAPAQRTSAEVSSAGEAEEEASPSWPTYPPEKTVRSQGGSPKICAAVTPRQTPAGCVTLLAWLKASARPERKSFPPSPPDPVASPAPKLPRPSPRFRSPAFGFSLPPAAAPAAPSGRLFRWEFSAGSPRSRISKEPYNAATPPADTLAVAPRLFPFPPLAPYKRPIAYRGHFFLPQLHFPAPLGTGLWKLRSPRARSDILVP